jgi:phage-related protein
VIDDIKDAFNELGKIKDFAEKIPNSISSIKDEVIDSTNFVKDSVNQIDNKLVDFSEKVKTSTIDVVGQEVKKIDDKIVGVADDLKKYTIDVVEKEVKKIDDKILDVIEQIKKYTIDLVTEKIYNLLKQLGNIFKDALVDPIVILFKGISNIFIGIFGILKEIANKIISLPNCIFPYMVNGLVSTIQSIYRLIIPDIIRNAIYTIHSYTLKYVTDKLYYWLGLDSYNSCYRFGVTDEINRIEENAKRIGDSFSNDFGRLDFSRINI